jgi:hypothetical protein
MDIDHFVSRSFRARNVGKHYQAIRTVEKFAGPNAADNIGRIVGARTRNEVFASNISKQNVLWKLLSETKC